MKSFIIFFFLTTLSVFSQKMTVQKLDSIFKSTAENVASKNSRWNFTINEIPFIAIADATHNRMRIISPIVEVSELSEELKTASLMANFHTALDIKYAITDNILWSAFIHPLKELSEKQVIDAISQVYYGNINFGSTFSSTSLVFPGRRTENTPKEKTVKDKMIKKI